jgi:RNA polymerase sigma-70 factor (ECF subfamily)
MKYLKDEEQAKDAVQAIFLKVLTEVNKYKIEYFKSWLYMVAKNHCLMHLRGNGSKMIKELKEEHIRKAEEEKDNLKENERTYEKLEQAINELNEEQRQCVILFYLKKNSYQQISEITGYSTMQVKSYIQNGKRNLRIILDKKLKEANSGNNG